MKCCEDGKEVSAGCFHDHCTGAIPDEEPLCDFCNSTVEHDLYLGSEDGRVSYYRYCDIMQIEYVDKRELLINKYLAKASVQLYTPF